MFTLRNPLGYLGFFALLGFLGFSQDRINLCFFGFLVYFRYFWVFPDEMFMNYTHKAASWGFFAGMMATLTATLAALASTNLVKGFRFGVSVGFIAALLVFSMVHCYYEFRENLAGARE